MVTTCGEIGAILQHVAWLVTCSLHMLAESPGTSGDMGTSPNELSYLVC